MQWLDWDKAMLALAMWREARGETDPQALRAVGHTIYNFAEESKFTVADACEHKLYISSLTYPHDPQLTTWPHYGDPQFAKAMAATDAIFAGKDVDPTMGATHYFNPGMVLPDWASKMVKTVSIGHHDFYKMP